MTFAEKFNGWLWSPEFLAPTDKITSQAHGRKQVSARKPKRSSTDNESCLPQPNAGQNESELQMSLASKRRRVIVDANNSIHAQVSTFIETMDRRRQIQAGSHHGDNVHRSLNSCTETVVASQENPDRELVSPEVLAERQRQSPIYNQLVRNRADRWEALIPSGTSHVFSGLSDLTDDRCPIAERNSAEMIESGFICPLPVDVVRQNAAELSSVCEHAAALEEIGGPPISMEWENCQLCEPNTARGERTCVAAKTGSCQGVLMAERTTFQAVEGAAVKEFLLPAQQKRFDETGALPDVHGFCLVCTRYLCTEALTRRGMLHTGAFRGNLCPYSVKVDEDGEYDSRACLWTNDPRTGCDRPFIQHADNRYMYAAKPDGTVYLQQVNVQYCPDDASSKNDQAASLDPRASFRREKWPLHRRV